MVVEIRQPRVNDEGQTAEAAIADPRETLAALAEEFGNPTS